MSVIPERLNPATLQHGKEGTRAAIAGTASANIASVVPPLEEEVKVLL